MLWNEGLKTNYLLEEKKNKVKINRHQGTNDLPQKTNYLFQKTNDRRKTKKKSSTKKMIDAKE